MRNREEKRTEGNTGSFLNYIICFTLVGIMILGTFLMPQIYSYHVDSKNIGNVNYEQREEVALATDRNLSVKDRTAIVTNLVSEGGISLSMNLDADQLYDDEWLESVKQEIKNAVECGILPVEMEQIDFDEAKGTLSADYYQLSNSVTEYGEMALWSVQYKVADEYEVTLLVDAENHKIYYGELSGGAISDAWMRNREKGGEGAYMNACMRYYEAEYAEEVWLDFVFEIEDAGRFGWVQERNNIGEIDSRRVTFGFDVFWEYFWGKSLLSVYGLDNVNDTNLMPN